jgi:signal transduction histidine kinase
VRVDGEVGCVAVADHGIGIPADAQQHIFERFHRVTNARTQDIKGMGIGLFVVKEIVDLHGGAVAVESQEGRGSTFTICLPQEREANELAPERLCG